jgi:hypothetical protein
VQGGFVGGLDLEDVASAAATVLRDVFVALDDVEVVVGDALPVEAPAGVATGAEGVVDHIADGGDAEGAETVEGSGTDPEELVAQDDVGLFGLGEVKEIAVEAAYTGAGDEAYYDAADEAAGRLVVEDVEGDDGVAETF